MVNRQVDGPHRSPLRILFLTDNFPPEVNAPASRTFEHARLWASWGHHVTVITCAPNFPTGKVFPGYRNRWWQVERMQGIRVIRVKTVIHANEGFVMRTLDYVSFMFSLLPAGMLVRSPDVIVATSPQFFCACGGWLLSLLKGRPFVFELRDLWPASIAAVGAMRHRRILRILEAIELFLYRRARAIIPVSGAFKTDLISRGIDAGKITVVTNGADLERFAPRARDHDLVKNLDIRGAFVVGYIGTHGMAHALDKVLDAAALCAANEPRIRFLFVGAGAAKDQIVTKAANMKLPNVIFLPPQPKEAMPAYWSVCDVALIPLKDSPVFATVIPSKLFEAMAMGIPVAMSVPKGEATGIMETAGAGIAIRPEDAPHMAESLIALSRSPERCLTIRNHALAAAPGYDRRRLARVLVNTLGKVASP